MRSEIDAVKAARGMRRRIKSVHPLVAEVACTIVMQSYEALMHHNEHWEMFKKQFPGKNARELEQIYLDWNWGRGVEAARETMAWMLDPRSGAVVDEADKEKIHEALVLDRGLQMGRTWRMN